MTQHEKHAARATDVQAPVPSAEVVVKVTRRRRWLRRAILIVLLAIALPLARPTYLVLRAWIQDRPAPENLPPSYVDDASRMNSAQVAEVWDIPADAPAAESQLGTLLARARKEKRRVTISGARHSMGGHTIFPDGIVLNMLPFDHLDLDASSKVLHAGAGARWSRVIPFLDARGLSVAIMQSNNDFTVGGSLSVNCHGWQPNRPPIASSVESFRLMGADGVIRRCSRSENKELFSLALGGYGLFGVILDADLSIVPNERYRPEVEVLPSAGFWERFHERVVGAPDVGMAYGRLCVVPGERTFLCEAILTVFHRSPCKPSEMPPLHDPGYAALRREIYRSQIGSDAGKALRWLAETNAARALTSHFLSRNQLLNERAAVYREAGAVRTDILHEYFVPPAKM
jgi:hypothetical protein